MNIIDQLEQIVTPAVLGSLINSDPTNNYYTDSGHISDDYANNASFIDNGSVSYISLLEQFYAILAARLALPQVYSQLLRDDSLIDNDNKVEAPLFEQLWQAPNSRQTIIQELATTHHVAEITTMKLIMNAAPLAYRELKAMANGQFLPAFLQNEQPSLRHYLPIWAAPIITVTQNATATQNTTDELFDYQNAVVNDAAVAVAPVSLNKYDSAEASVITPTASVATDPVNASLDDSLNTVSIDTNALDTGAIHVNPAEHHLAENPSLKRERVRTRNQRNDLLVRVFLLLAAIAAIGLVWALLIKPNDAPPVAPVVTDTPVAPPTDEPPVQVLTPAELIVGVDDSGSLYTCRATVGDAALQSALQQALTSSFGEQASVCQFTVQEGVAESIANMPIEALPNILTLLRATPFARLQLQNDRVTVEAPDTMQLQRLTTDIRTLVPVMMVDSTAPLPLPNNGGSSMEANNVASMNGANNQVATTGNGVNDPYAANNNTNNNNNYQAADDNTGDSVAPAPARNNNFNNPPLNNIPSNNERLNNERVNDASTRPSGPISESEVDDMANSVIVAEPAQVR